MSILHIQRQSPTELLLEPEANTPASRIRRRLRHIWEETTDVFQKIKQGLWPSEEALSAKKLLFAIGKSLLLLVLLGLLGVAAALSIVGLYLVLLLICIALWMGAWALIQISVTTVAALPVEPRRVDSNLKRLHLRRIQEDLRVRLGEIDLSVSEIKAFRVLIEPSASGLRRLVISLQTTSKGEVVAPFQVNQLEREEEAIELAFKLGRLMRYRAYRARRHPLLGLEVTLLPMLTQAKGDDPFRAMEGDLHEREIPRGAEELDLETLKAQEAFMEPEVPLEPFTPTKLTGRYRVSWSLPDSVEFTIERSRNVGRVLLALLAGLLLIGVLSGVVYVLGMVFFGTSLSNIEGGSKDMDVILAGLTAASGLLGWMMSLPLLWKKRKHQEVTFDLSNKQLRVVDMEDTSRYDTSKVQELILRQLEGGVYRLDVVVAERGVLVLYEGESLDLGAMPIELSMLVELARALSVPWRCESLI